MRPLKNLCEVAVIGGGLAGLSAARHAARLGRLVTLFEGSALFGGLVATIGEVDGLPVPGTFSGQELAIHLLEDARKVGVQVIDAAVTRIELNSARSNGGQSNGTRPNSTRPNSRRPNSRRPNGQPALTDSHNTIHHPEAIIIASGVSPRKLSVPGEEEFVGRGVSRCATCDGGFFRGEDVVVVGGGDGAVHEALVLAKTSRHVHIVCRSPLKAKREYIDKLAGRENVSFIWDSEVSEILGNDGVSAVRLRNVKDGTRSDIACMGLFPFIGGTPNTDFVPASLLAATGHVKTSAGFVTSDARVFAVGAVRAGYGGNVVEAMAEGVGAAESVTRRN